MLRRILGDAGEEPCCGEEAGLAEDEEQHVAAACAERHAHADFAGALRDRIRQHAVNADSCEGERDAGRRCRGAWRSFAGGLAESESTRRVVSTLIDRLVGVDGPDGVGDSG